LHDTTNCAHRDFNEVCFCLQGDDNDMNDSNICVKALGLLVCFVPFASFKLLQFILFPVYVILEWLTRQIPHFIQFTFGLVVSIAFDAAIMVPRFILSGVLTLLYSLFYCFNSSIILTYNACQHCTLLRTCIASLCNCLTKFVFDPLCHCCEYICEKLTCCCEYVSQCMDFICCTMLYGCCERMVNCCHHICNCLLDMITPVCKCISRACSSMYSCITCICQPIWDCISGVCTKLMEFANMIVSAVNEYLCVPLCTCISTVLDAIYVYFIHPVYSCTVYVFELFITMLSFVYDVLVQVFVALFNITVVPLYNVVTAMFDAVMSIF
jgi:hypothetical protein